ncbi:N-(5'-phosphoribosyl)anthranilate isomerase [Pedobacter yulinensis]|uniref:N-(5'-phosphoribosyl)anthranilate isomerase n=2 Tax=Pedobacter yulinensis TaxID=2126353 RepID=A0A2T3HMX2_9SPHI|nr:N-(5'-phosphoribosyl)anthranilate isomerase [Pedobacter yulinensis]
MREAGNISELAELAPDYMGFIFYEASPRFAGAMQPQILASLPAAIARTGVFVNTPPARVADAVTHYGLDAVQLHGSESPADCAAIAACFTGRPRPELIKAFGVDPGFDFSQTAAYENVADYFLFDTRSPAHGGSGKTFDWNLLAGYKGSKAFFLSGGIGPEHLANLLRLDDSRLYAVDLNSRFELAPALKDIAELATTINTLRGNAAQP